MALADDLAELMGDLHIVYDPLTHITTDTIECDPAGFARWLNALVDRVNQHDYMLVKLIEAVKELRDAIICLEEALRELELRVEELEIWREAVELTLINLQNQIDNLQQQINVINNRLTAIENTLANHETRITNLEADLSWYNARLPRAKSSIPTSMKFAMGNINVMSANGGTPSLDVGIFTSAAIENNDIYFY